MQYKLLKILTINKNNNMKIKELIEQLKKYDPEMLVVARGYESGWDDINIIKEQILIEWENNPWYEGKYPYFEEKKDNPDNAIKAITLSK